MFAYVEAENIELRLDGAETQVRRLKADRPGRRASVSGKRGQNTIKTTTFSYGQGRLLYSGVERPGRMHDQTAVRTEGIAEQVRTRPSVKAKADSGYQGLAKEFPHQVTAPPKKPKEDACDGDKYAWREARRRQTSARICVEHTNAELRQWAPMRRFTGDRETFPETQRVIASLISDRAAKRPTRREYSTELVLARDIAC
ncbi:transposase family protein [Streptomyces sp. B21-083]|uniref:transposase family protein n=1 Tax=Streptomyces sp. B21-083 TaxID=3039410 RepID=UPI002FF0D52B